MAERCQLTVICLSPIRPFEGAGQTRVDGSLGDIKSSDEVLPASADPQTHRVSFAGEGQVPLRAFNNDVGWHGLVR